MTTTSGRYERIFAALDIEKLIREVKECPAIWNPRCWSYSDRGERAKQWDKLVDVFSEPGMLPAEKRMLGFGLRKKWRNIRDSFAKEKRRLAALKTTCPSGIKKREYIYYDNLTFMTDVISRRSHESSLTDRKQSKQDRRVAKCERKQNKRAKKRYECSESSSPSSSADESTSRRRKKAKNNTEYVREESKETGTDNNTDIRCNKNANDEDADRCFMLSLLDDFKSVPARMKPIVKINIIKCIMKAQEPDAAREFRENPLRFSTDNLQTDNEREDTKPIIDNEVLSQPHNHNYLDSESE